MTNAKKILIATFVFVIFIALLVAGLLFEANRHRRMAISMAKNAVKEWVSGNVVVVDATLPDECLNAEIVDYDHSDFLLGFHQIEFALKSPKHADECYLAVRIEFPLRIWLFDVANRNGIVYILDDEGYHIFEMSDEK